MKKSRNHPQLAEHDLENVLNTFPGSVYALRPDSGEDFPYYVNQVCLDMLEVDSREDAISYSDGNFWKFVDRGDVQMVKDVYDRLYEAPGSTESFDCNIITKKGNRRLVHVIAKSGRDADGCINIVDLSMDLYVWSADSNEAGIDHVTGLLNMYAFFKVMRQHRDEKEDHAGLTILFIDVVNFRGINLHNGIAYGDQFLRAVGRCMRSCFPGSPAAHFDADHFVLAAEGKNILQQAGRLRAMIRKMAPNFVDCRIGACRWDDPDLTPEIVCERARIACNHSKKLVNTFFSFYTKQMGENMATAEYVVSNLDEAIRRNWIVVYYQPVLRTVSGQICGMEALVRWKNPERGLLSPAVFIKPLEEAQFVWKLDLCVIRQVLQNLASRDRQNLPEIPVSVNLSRVDFLCCDIFEEIEELVRQYDIPRRLLHLEVTESTLTSRRVEVSKTLDKLRDAGYEIWMDDFGSGYSTLNLLKDYNFDVLKLDLEFLRKDTQRSREIIAAVISMDKMIGNQTLAEGVETREQVEFLKKCG